MKDISRGRIYRLAPGHKPAPVTVDLRSDAGLADALRSPAQSRGTWPTRLKGGARGAGGAAGVAGDRYPPARCGCSARFPGKKKVAGLADPDPNSHRRDPIPQLGGDDIVRVTPAAAHPSPARREIAIAWRRAHAQALDSLIELCRQYDSRDCWYLEARASRPGARARSTAQAWPRSRRLIRSSAGCGGIRPSDARPPHRGLRNWPSPSSSGEALDASRRWPRPEAPRWPTDQSPGHAAEPRRGLLESSHRLFSEWIDLPRTRPWPRRSAMRAPAAPVRSANDDLEIPDTLRAAGHRQIADAPKKSAPPPSRRWAARARRSTCLTSSPCCATGRCASA
jgi:hypothetical protein